MVPIDPQCYVQDEDHGSDTVSVISASPATLPCDVRSTDTGHRTLRKQEPLAVHAVHTGLDDDPAPGDGDHTITDWRPGKLHGNRRVQRVSRVRGVKHGGHDRAVRIGDKDVAAGAGAESRAGYLRRVLRLRARRRTVSAERQPSPVRRGAA